MIFIKRWPPYIYIMIIVDKFHCVQQANYVNICLVVPPFIPMVTGSTDTSNFDTFEPVDDLKDSLASHKSSRVFTGKNLPFVGFTYTSWTPYEVSETSSVMPAGSVVLTITCMVITTYVFCFRIPTQYIYMYMYY